MESEERTPFSLADIERRVLASWRDKEIFKKSVDQRVGSQEFVFYEGPPTANGTPGVHHVEARAFKDVMLRYKTMRGFSVPRRAGWDTHGLPVELQVEKELGLKNKKDIEAYGVAAFNKKCKESVWKYREMWEQLTDRMGFWVDMSRAYVTYKNEYIESLWWVIKQFANKGYLYEDYKVVPWCARCGTALSSHEIAQGYEEVEDESVYVKFLLGEGGGKKKYILAWTTTPWTLPGNTALAVNATADYVEIADGKDTIIVAEARVKVLGDDHGEVLKKIKGADLVGLRYEPLYQATNHKLSTTDYSIIAGDFVSLDDGTGIVHIAPAFGDDDFQVGKKNGLSVLMTTNEQGLMQTPGELWHELIFKTRDKKDKTANALIKKDLEKRGILLKTELYKHDYPFCWRCKNPLMYFARKAWWVSVNSVRPALIANNETINWYPDYLKHGRFGGWLKEEKDWAFSRERYWGTPLPVWRCEECKHWEVIGSLHELASRSVTAGNRYIMMRHGEAEQNVKGMCAGDLSNDHNPLTEKGKKQIQESIVALKEKNLTPDVIVTSPFMRAKETADMLVQAFNLPKTSLVVDERLREIGTGAMTGKSVKEYIALFSNQLERFSKAPPEGETLDRVKERILLAIQDLEKQYQGKTILIVSHEDALWMLWAASGALENQRVIDEKANNNWSFISTGSWRELQYVSLPRDEKGSLDFHKPYIDEVVIRCTKCSAYMHRVPEVVDVWFDSGAMPYAQDHFPFFTQATKDESFDLLSPDFSKIHYPADYIVEAVDQTRGWFYNLLSIATLLGQPAPYKNVISLGHVLDTKGKKMSKSLGNIVDPQMLIEKYGADSVRWYFFTVNQPWDSKLFDEKDIQDTSRRFFTIFWNSFQFWKLYGVGEASIAAANPTTVMNRWIVARLQKKLTEVTTAMDSYDIVGAARTIENFVVEDLSRWYIRRIRGVVKEKNNESQETIETLRFVLIETAKMIAPFAPFLVEEIYRELGGKDESIHLSEWPEVNTLPDRAALLEAMVSARVLVAAALEARAKAGVKVRQPLQKIKIKSFGPRPTSLGLEKSKIAEEIFDVIKEEINVKEIVCDPALEEEVWLDAEITPELREEGHVREMVRAIQDARKRAGLMPGDKASFVVVAPSDIAAVVRKQGQDFRDSVGASVIHVTEGDKIEVSVQ
jgi:isoleucyl-tRNA synthetase